MLEEIEKERYKMILSSIGKILKIRKIEADDGAHGLIIRVDAPDGTTVEIMRECDLQPAYAEIRDGVASFTAELVAVNSDYRISFRNAAGDYLTTAFTVHKGVIRRKLGPLDAELAEMWEALLTLVDEIHADEEKLEAVVDGFVSE